MTTRRSILSTGEWQGIQSLEWLDFADWLTCPAVIPADERELPTEGVGIWDIVLKGQR